MVGVIPQTDRPGRGHYRDQANLFGPMRKLSTNRHWGDRMKLHRYRPTADGQAYSVFCLRPGLEVSWSSNYFHATWHILGNMRSARVLAHLMWGLSYHGDERSFVFIDPSYTKPNPFDAKAADSVLVGLRRPPRALLRRLKKPLGRSATVRWRTFGLADAQSGERALPSWDSTEVIRVDRQLSCIAIFGSRRALRGESAAIAQLRTTPSRKDYAHTDYHFIADETDGEVQIFHDFLKRVEQARAAQTMLRQGEPEAAPSFPP